MAPRLPDRAAASTIGRRLRALGLRRRFGWDERGIAAVEFALIIPILITLLFGMTEVAVGMSMNRKLVGLSRSVVDLASRVSSISTTDMANIFAASSAMMQPYDSTNLKMVLTSVLVTQIGSTYIGTVDWSCAKGTGATARIIGTPYTVPNGFKDNLSHFLVAETTIPYKPMFGYTFTGTMTLSSTTPWPVRNVTQVIGPGVCPV